MNGTWAIHGSLAGAGLFRSPRRRDGFKVGGQGHVVLDLIFEECFQ